MNLHPIAELVIVLVASFLGAWLLTTVLRFVVARTTRRTRVTWDDHLAEKLSGPVSMFVGIQAFRISLQWSELSAPAISTLGQVLAVFSIIVVVWGMFRLVDLSRGILEQRAWAIERPSSRSLLALAGRFAKAAILVFGLLVGLSQIGVSVASLIAGLGIGGLVIALAAQRTVENLFGALSIGVDQPLREGDFVRVYDFVGTVEQIGLRSTRIRTLDRTLVTIPNGELANQRIESYTVRDRIRLACTIGLVYETTGDQMRAVLAALERVLRKHPKIWSESVVVRFKEFSSSSLDIEIMAWFETSDWGEFQLIRQGVLLEFMATIEAAGSSFAFPTRTLHHVGEVGQASSRARANGTTLHRQ